VGEEILINVTPREVRAALVENGVLQEVLIERASRRGLISNIYKGKVRRVLPGMQAAFIDIGLERTAFLHENDISRGPDSENGAALPASLGIRDLLREGGDVLVQVLKDPLGSKGARLTTYITLPSRYLVLMPRGQGIGVSSRIEDERERARLRGIMETIVPDQSGAGFIVRTAAEGAGLDALRADMLFLQKLWQSIEQRSQGIVAGHLVHEDLQLSLRVLRDLLSAEMERVQVDSEQAYTRMRGFAEMFVPQLVPMIEHYTGSRPIFDLHNIEEEIQLALDRKVALKSGGYLMIDQTEAMTTIDINTGAYVGHRNLEDTIFRTNLEAAVSIARQLRLRNLGGIIIIDFIDMLEAGHRRQVLQALEQALARDPARTQVMEVSALGLVEMTRKRTRESLERMLCEPCPTCEGRGFVRTAETVCYEIFREIVRQTRQFQFQALMVMAHQDVVERLLDEESASLAELEEFTGKPIRLQTDAIYSQEQFDVVLM
jgi:ribonuclease G